MRQHPGAVLGAVEAALRAHGLTRLYGAACARIGVLSVAYQVTAWCDGHTLTWRHHGEEITWPAADPEGAAARLAALARTSDGPDNPGDPAARPPAPR